MVNWSFVDESDQCWGKLLLNVMRYNIALLPEKSNYSVTVHRKREQKLYFW